MLTEINADRIGKYVPSPTFSNVKTYIPTRLPPNPKIRIENLFHQIEYANLGLGKLEGVLSYLAEISSLTTLFEWKEALLSSQIEGIQANFSDILLHQNEGIVSNSLDDIQEVVNYKNSMQCGLNEIKTLPISSRLIRKVHHKLLQGPRGLTKTPGIFRRSQNWIGGTHPSNAKFVPPPPTEVPNLMSDLEKFINSDTKDIPFLVKLGLVHIQFETIHPFLDGNGRIGRQLIDLMLNEQNILSKPILALSTYLKSNRNEYYFHLNNVRVTGDWESWLKYLLNGIIEATDQAVQTVHKVLELFKSDNQKIQSLGRARYSGHYLHQIFQNIPISSIPNLIKKMQVTAPAVHNAIENLEKLEILHEITGRKRGRIYIYKEYYDILSEGTEPI